MNNKKKWKLNAKAALEKRGIVNPFGLWQKIGGSKETATHLFNGTTTMVRLDTFNRLEEHFGITPYEILVKE